MKPSIYQGKLKTWQDDRGFGFIQSNDGNEDIFLHISEIKNSLRRPQVGDIIRYQITRDKKGKIRAIEATIEGAAYKPVAKQTIKKGKSKLESLISLPIFGVQILLLAFMPLGGSIQLALTTANIIPLMLYPLMSLITFLLYYHDKSSAKQGERRIPEKTLHLFELAGGWLGAFIAQKTLRHKCIKKSYQSVFWFIVGIHLIFWLDWLFLEKNIINHLFGK